LLEVDTVLGAAKRLAAAAGVEIAGGSPVRGYEMHLGITAGAERPMLRLGDRADGAVSADGRVAGCYLHGLFASDPFRRALLARLGAGAGPFAYESLIDDTLDRLAEHLAASLDLDALHAAARAPRLTKAA
ncbi:MAG: cobyric acid synthase CobQ, partial [Alphaproteobacteria bacterium]|nr:cobyric acid synthase CobQ [Alphaproteobacteria bacterium]